MDILDLIYYKNYSFEEIEINCIKALKNVKSASYLNDAVIITLKNYAEVKFSGKINDF